LEWMADPWGDVTRAGDWLLELEARFAPGVVHLNHYCYGSLPWDAPVLIAAHGCVLTWWQAVHGEGSPQSWTRYHAEVAAGLRGANMVTAPTQAMLDGLTRLYAPIPRLFSTQNAPRFPAFRVIPHGADPERFQPLAKRPFILSAGNAGDGACNGELLDAVAAELPWPVAWAPEGEIPGVCKHLQICEARADAADLFGQAAVFALPSRYEPFGFAPLHAALAGCALVLGDIPSLRETWGDAALYASPEDAPAFGAALRRLVEDASFRETMAARARARALEWTPRRMAEEMRACYRALHAPRPETVVA
ncbi:MAG: glycosyltransferase family 4 protein, partial [Chthoniobacteraceae bacterium]|nr:glycosyltransferase family 4 protein [Chthoniobacteraceae bacterium]